MSLAPTNSMRRRAGGAASGSVAVAVIHAGARAEDGVAVAQPAGRMRGFRAGGAVTVTRAPKKDRVQVRRSSLPTPSPNGLAVVSLRTRTV